MEKFYNSYDRLFLAHPSFEGTFTDIDGNKFSGKIEGACIFLSIIAVNKETGEPKYSINDTKENLVENSLFNRFFWATIDAENGVLIIPNTRAICEFEEKENLNIACKILEYSIDVVEEGRIGCTPKFVTEAEFVRVIQEHYRNFNNIDNYHAQSTSYSYHRIDWEYSRIIV